MSTFVTIKVQDTIQVDEFEARLTCGVDGFHVWDFFAPKLSNSLRHKVGQVVLTREIGSDMWTVANLFLRDSITNKHAKFVGLKSEAIDVNIRGRGIMRRFLMMILPRYGKICADRSGTWSDDAIKMWKAIGAKRLKTKECPKGFVYVIEV